MSNERFPVARLGTMRLCSALLLVLCELGVPLTSEAQSLTVTAPVQISTAKGNAPTDDISIDAAAPPNANLVAFASYAGNLDLSQSDTNGGADVFLYSPASTPNLSRQSVNTNGEQSSSSSNDFRPSSIAPAISPALPDGKYGIAFSSVADSLLAAEGFNRTFTRQVYLRLPFANRTLLLSKGVNGEAGNGDSDCPSVTSIPGAYPTFKVAYISRAGNLRTPALLGSRTTWALYLSTVVVKSSSEVETSVIELFAKDNAQFECPVISGDGRFVAFASTATDLIADRVTAGTQLFRFDLNKLGTGRPVLLSAVAGVDYGQGPSFFPSISYTGDAVVFTTQATNLNVSASASAPKVVLYKDGVTGLALVNKNASGVASDALYFIEDPQPVGSISADGRMVAFVDKATNLVSPATATRMHVYVKGLDSSSAAPLLVSKTEAGAEVNSDCEAPVLGASSFGASSAFVAFNTAASNVGIPGTSITFSRVFRSSISVSQPPITEDYKIPVPPNAVVRNRQVTFTFLRFSTSAAASMKAQSKEDFAASAGKVTYTLTVRGTGKNRTRISRTTNRNRVTISRLNPGTYVARYKATRTSSSKKRPVSTKQSPQRKFTIS